VKIEGEEKWSSGLKESSTLFGLRGFNNRVAAASLLDPTAYRGRRRILSLLYRLFGGSSKGLTH